MQIFPANPSGGVLIWKRKAYTLTAIEYNMLRHIVEDGPIAANKLGLLIFPVSPEDCWQRMVSVYVRRIRKKIGANVIRASRKGYQIGDEKEAELQESGVRRTIRLR